MLRVIEREVQDTLEGDSRLKGREDSFEVSFKVKFIPRVGIWW